MRSHLLLSAVAMTAVALSARQASAQRGTASANRLRPMATYDFGARPRAIAFPMSVTVADSAGTLVAKATMPGERGLRPLTVTVVESNLVLQGETRDGTITLVLDQQAQGSTTKVVNGRWSVGQASGALRARGRA